MSARLRILSQTRTSRVRPDMTVDLIPLARSRIMTVARLLAQLRIMTVVPRPVPLEIMTVARLLAQLRITIAVPRPVPLGIMTVVPLLAADTRQVIGIAGLDRDARQVS